MGLLLLTDDVMSLADRVQTGDPVVGWRGDPEADVYVDDEIGEAAVYTFDRHRQRYMAARVSTWDPGWRHELLKKLRDGDWQNPDAYKQARAKMDKEDADRERRIAEQQREVAEKFAFAAERDNGIKRMF